MLLFFFYILLNSIEQKGEGNVNRTNHTGKTMLGYGIGIGVAVSVAVSIGLLLVLTSLLMNKRLSENMMATAMFLVRPLSILIGFLSGSFILKEKKLILAGATVVGYLFVMLALGITAFDGGFHGFGSGVISVLIGGGISCLILLKPKTKGKYTHKYKL